MHYGFQNMTQTKYNKKLAVLCSIVSERYVQLAVYIYQ